ncbi:MAG: NAD(P)H-binding protein [Candidatus Paceibacterota bacterium]
MEKHVSIVGASGFLGTNLITYLLEHTDWKITAISPDPEHVTIEDDRLINLEGDVFDTTALQEHISGSHVVYYFVHMMGADGDYFELEEEASRSMGRAAENARVGRIIDMSGLGKDTDNLSKHLASRHNAGRVLREFQTSVIEFRASMIVGEGSISFQIVKNLAEKLRILIMPITAETCTQPIGITDMLTYLHVAATVEIDGDKIVEVGGPEVVSYAELILMYSQWSGDSTTVICTRLLPPFIAGLLLRLFNPPHVAKVGRAMVDSFRNEMIVTDYTHKILFPDITPGLIENDF